MPAATASHQNPQFSTACRQVMFGKGNLKMNKYDDFLEKSKIRTRVDNDYEQKCISMIINFLNGYINYLNAPANNVRLCKVNSEIDGVERYSQASNPSAAISKLDHGAYGFGLEIVIGNIDDDGFNKQPNGTILITESVKYYLFFDIMMKTKENGVIFLNKLDNNSPDHFIKFDDTIGDMEKFYSYLTGLLDGTMDLKPWDGDKKSPIGFDISGGR